MHVPADVSLAQCVALYEREIEVSRSIAAEHSLDDLTVRIDTEPGLRRLAAEPALDPGAHDRGVRPPRGHADLIRERIDGATGD